MELDKDPEQPEDERSVEVDEALETCVVNVESAVVTYLVRITGESRDALVAALEALDADTSASDAFRTRLNALVSLTGVAGLGASTLDVIGQSSRFPVVNQVPLPVFRAQVAVVRAAKDEIRLASPDALAALEAANDALAAARSRYMR